MAFNKVEFVNGRYRIVIATRDNTYVGESHWLSAEEAQELNENLKQNIANPVTGYSLPFGAHSEVHIKTDAIESFSLEYMGKA